MNQQHPTGISDSGMSSDSIDHSNDSLMRETDLIEFPVIRNSLAALHIGAIAMSALGNGLLIAYVLWHRRRHGRVNVPAATNLILNLAVCDFVSSAVNQPMRLFDMLSQTRGFEDTIEFCQVSGFVALFLACAAFHTIVAISQERLLLICYPLMARTYLTSNVTWRILLSIWIVAFFSALPFPVLFSYRVDIRLPNNTYRFCTIDIFRSNYNLGRYYYFFIFFVYYALPVVVVVASYARVFHALSSTTAYGRSSVKEEVVARTLRHRKALAWMMVAVAVSFAAFEGPFFVTFLYFSLGFRFSKNHVFIKMVIDFLPLLSSVVNPSVYLARAKTFKRSIGSLASEAPRTVPGTVRRAEQEPAVTFSSGQQCLGVKPRSLSPYHQGVREILLSHVFGATTHLARLAPSVAALPTCASVQREAGSHTERD